MKFVQKIWQRVREVMPLSGFYFDRPIVLFQSDDWGRVGVRDREGWEQLRSAGMNLGERAYDFYTLESAEDVSELRNVMLRHRDSNGRTPCIEMNFVPVNLDFERMKAGGFTTIELLTIAQGWPEGWKRPGLLEAYREGVEAGVFCVALHGSTHFCRPGVERNLQEEGQRAELLRTLWQAGTPYIHWRMPWIGFEYWNPEQPPEQRFLSMEDQRALIGQTFGAFAKLFSALPRSACAPGYRANQDTQLAWSQHGIRVAQNGPGSFRPPHFGSSNVLQLSRNIEFEPATDDSFSIDTCMRNAQACIDRGIPAIVSVHSINFHSTLKDFRTRTIGLLDEFLDALEAKYSNLMYLHDDDLYELINRGEYQGVNGVVRVNVTRETFTARKMAKPVESREDV